MNKIKMLLQHFSRQSYLQARLLLSMLFIISTVFLLSPMLVKAKSLVFTHTFSGETLNIQPAEGEEVTAAVKAMLTQGENPYIGNQDSIEEGEPLYMRNCGVCHGIDVKGRMGPNLTDATWNYAKNKTDKGFFETVYGGSAGLMKGLNGVMTLDEMLLVMAYIRSLSE